MIVETMTRDEIFREIREDDEWVALRCTGLRKKYNKALKDKRVKNCALLGTVEYTTPRHNKVYCIVQKLYCDDKEKYAIPTIISLYEFTSSDGKRRYIYPLQYMQSNRIQSLIVFSDHAISRLRERCNKSMMDLFYDICLVNDSCMSWLKYDFNKRDDEHFSVVGDTILFARDCEWGVTVTTILNKNQLFENQDEMEEFLQGHIRELMEENKQDYKTRYDKTILKTVAIKAA